MNIPKGNVQASLPLAVIENDDDFFHVTCHLDDNLREKIERGEFVDLERLLPKDRQSGKAQDDKIEIFSRDGVAYFAPTQDRSGNRINGLRKWE